MMFAVNKLRENKAKDHITQGFFPVTWFASASCYFGIESRLTFQDLRMRYAEQRATINPFRKNSVQSNGLVGCTSISYD